MPKYLILTQPHVELINEQLPKMSQMQVLWAGSPLLLICSFLLTLMALRRINHDDKLLKAADRIR